MLVYQTEPLEQDVDARRAARRRRSSSRTTGTDADFVVKLIDVYPDDFPDPDPNPTGVHMGGYQQLVRGEVYPRQVPQQLREARAVQAGQAEKIEFTMPDVSTRSAGPPHHGAGAEPWFPLVDRNPQTFVRHLQRQGGGFPEGDARVYRTPDQASCVLVPVRTK